MWDACFAARPTALALGARKDGFLLNQPGIAKGGLAPWCFAIHKCDLMASLLQVLGNGYSDHASTQNQNLTCHKSINFLLGSCSLCFVTVLHALAHPGNGYCGNQDEPDVAEHGIHHADQADKSKHATGIGNDARY